MFYFVSSLQRQLIQGYMDVILVLWVDLELDIVYLCVCWNQKEFTYANLRRWDTWNINALSTRITQVCYSYWMYIYISFRRYHIYMIKSKYTYQNSTTMLTQSEYSIEEMFAAQLQILIVPYWSAFMPQNTNIIREWICLW